MTEDEEGNELLLYHLEPGDTCAMTLFCCMDGRQSQIRVISEKDSTIIFVPVARLEEWLLEFASWRKFMFRSFSARFQEMLEAIDGLAFKNLEERLSHYLREKSKALQSNELPLTHLQISQELNTSRVVVSRLMKKLEKDGELEQHRNLVVFKDSSRKPSV